MFNTRLDGLLIVTKIKFYDKEIVDSRTRTLNKIIINYHTVHM